MGFGGGAWLRPLSLSPPALWWAGAEAQSQVCEARGEGGEARE